MTPEQYRSLFEEFSSPPREFSPAPIWWWSGEALDPARLRWQMERFAEGGVFNLVILNLAPTGPLYGSGPDSPFFLSEAWWRIFEGVCKDAARLKIRLWFYDQIGFSGANFQGQVVAAHPAFAGESLECVMAEGEGPLSVQMPPEGKALGAAVWNLGTKAGKARLVKVSKGRAAHQGSGRRRLRLFYSVKRGFDYFNREACDTLIARVHGQFEARAKHWFGSVIAGSFQDELPNVPNWGPGFAAAFKKRCGYDLLPRLASLWEGETPEDIKTRVDYHASRAELQEEAFFKPLFYWHERHGLICGVDQQGDARSGNPSDGVRIYADYLRTHRWFGAPGSDQHGETKVHSSLAHLYGRERVWIESFHSSGWGGTLEETFDWLLPWIRAGATLYNPHAAYYSTRGGWYEWAPPSTCWRQPYWRHYPLFARSVARLCRLLSRGSHLAQVGVLFPNTAAQAGRTMVGEGPRAQAARESYKALVGQMFFNQPVPGTLDRDRRDFDILDDDSVARAEINSSGLSVAGETYQALILPSCSVIESATLERLEAFAKAGHILVSLGSRPEWVLTSKGLKPLRSLKTIPHAEKPEDLAPLLARLKRQVEAPVTTLRRRVDGSDIVLLPAIHPRATRRLENGSWDPFNYAFDSEAYAKDMEVLVRGVTGQPELWDPFTGTRKAVQAQPHEDGVLVKVPLDQGPAALLVWPPKAAPALKPQAPRKDSLELALQGNWESELIPTLDNRHGDFDRPAAPGAPALQGWHFMHRSEQDAENGLALGWSLPGADEAGFKEVKAGYGLFGWRTGVQDRIWCPDPLSSEDASRGLLDARGLLPVLYSLSRGIDLDPIHLGHLGPKGHVPEEFIRFGKAKAGQCALFRTAFHLDRAASLTLAVGARAAKAVWLDGMLLKEEESEEAYLWTRVLKLGKGRHVLEFRLCALEEGELRAYWALLKDAKAFARPEWMKAPGFSKKDSQAVFSLEMDLGFEPVKATVQVAADAPRCRLLVNGVEAGRHGGFDPYGSNFRVMPYPVVNFKKGKNHIRVEMLDPGSGHLSALVDGLIEGEAGKSAELMSGPHWKVRRDEGLAQSALPYPGPVLNSWTCHDPAWFMLRRRPHPLPEAMWLEDKAAPGVVQDLTPQALSQKTRVEWLRWILPPGAVGMRLALQDKARIWVDGKELTLRGGSVKLPGPGKRLRRAALRVETKGGRNQGALFSRPVEYSMASGTMDLGNWGSQGLRSYSGGVSYRKTFELDSASTKLSLDLGRVRGTVELRLNGKELGARFLAPYRFDLGSAVKKGRNRLEISVFNTLAPYLRSVSPTSYVFPGQEESGLFGPVRILRT